MGIITKMIKNALAKRHKEQQKTEPAQQIEHFIESEKMKNKINYALEFERQNFLYGKGN